jgi:hypothetical protein
VRFCFCLLKEISGIAADSPREPLADFRMVQPILTLDVPDLGFCNSAQEPHCSQPSRRWLAKRELAPGS